MNDTLFHQTVASPPKSLNYMDATKIRTYLGCQRQFSLSYVLGLVPDESNVSLVWGSAMHEAIQRVLEGGDDRLEYAMEGFDKIWLENYEADEVVLSQKAKTRDTAARIVIMFMMNAHFWEDMVIKALEYSFVAKYNLTGKIDAVYSELHYPDRGLMFMDIKTKGGYGSDFWFNDFYHSIQMGMYAHALREAFPNEVSSKGVYFSILGLFANNSTHADKLIQKRTFFYSNKHIDVMQQAIMRARESMISKINYSKRVWTLKNFHRNPSSCGWCPFKDWCFDIDEPVELLPVDKFNIEHWDVAKVNEEFIEKVKEEIGADNASFGVFAGKE